MQVRNNFLKIVYLITLLSGFIKQYPQKNFRAISTIFIVGTENREPKITHERYVALKSGKL